MYSLSCSRGFFLLPALALVAVLALTLACGDDSDSRDRSEREDREPRSSARESSSSDRARSSSDEEPAEPRWNIRGGSGGQGLEDILELIPASADYLLAVDASAIMGGEAPGAWTIFKNEFLSTIEEYRYLEDFDIALEDVGILVLAGTLNGDFDSAFLGGRFSAEGIAETTENEPEEHLGYRLWPNLAFIDEERVIIEDTDQDELLIIVDALDTGDHLDSDHLMMQALEQVSSGWLASATTNPEDLWNLPPAIGDSCLAGAISAASVEGGEVRIELAFLFGNRADARAALPVIDGVMATSFATQVPSFSHESRADDELVFVEVSLDDPDLLALLEASSSWFSDGPPQPTEVLPQQSS